MNIVVNEGESLELTWEQFKTDKQGAIIKIERLSILIKRKQNTLFGHLIRSGETDKILREVSIGDDEHKITRVWAHKKRVGKPRDNWVVQTRNRVSNSLLGGEKFNENNATHHEIVIAAAHERTF